MPSDFVLLDLDGVVVFEAGPPLLSQIELLLLHQDLNRRAAEFGASIIVLTHRSRREAQQILHVAGLTKPVLAGVIAAEDLLFAGLRFSRTSMLRQGLRKNFALPVIERKFGADRSRLAFIDDRPDNLHDLLTAGLGLAMHAPSSFTLANGAAIESFDFAEAVAVYRAWDKTRSVREPHALSSRLLPVSAWQRTGLSTASHSRHVFNGVRGIARRARKVLSRPTPGKIDGF